MGQLQLWAFEKFKLGDGGSNLFVLPQVKLCITLACVYLSEVERTSKLVHICESPGH